MRKSLLSFLVIVFGCSFLYGYDDGNFYVWRSSEPTASNNVVISTVAAKIHSVIVTSGSISSSELFFFGTSTMPTSTDLTLTRTTSTVYDCSTRFVYPVQKNFSNGFGYYYSGTAKIRILWEYMFRAPKGFESTGY